MQDLQGPKIRTGSLEGGKRSELRAGAPITITTRPMAGNDRCISTTFQRLPAVFTQSGSSACLISKYRPRVPVFAFSPFANVMRRTALYWGVTPVHMQRLRSTDRMVEAAARRLREMGIVNPGDFVAVIAGNPIAKRGSTNFLKVHRIE